MGSMAVHAWAFSISKFDKLPQSFIEKIMHFTVEMFKILYLLCPRKAVISIYVAFSTYNSLTAAFSLQGQRTLRPRGLLASQCQPTICCNGDHGWEVSKTHIWSCWWACAQSPRNVGKWDSQHLYSIYRGRRDQSHESSLAVVLVVFERTNFDVGSQVDF